MVIFVILVMISFNIISATAYLWGETMIIQLKGKVTYPITLDASVWIFDDRKVIFEEAFIAREEEEKEDKAKKAAQLFDQELYFKTKIKPPVNKTLNRYEKEQALTHSFVMPISDFINNAEVEDDATKAILKTNSDDVVITIDQLINAYILFAVDGQPVKEDGPVHLFFGDGSNKTDPITGVKEITIT